MTVDRLTNGCGDTGCAGTRTPPSAAGSSTPSLPSADGGTTTSPSPSFDGGADGAMTQPSVDGGTDGAGPPIPPGFPDETNTGPAAGTVFTDYTGLYEIFGDNVVVDGMRVKGAIIVHGNNVTIKNCEVDASGQIWGISTAQGVSVSGLKVFNCHVYGVPVLADQPGTHVLCGISGAEEIAFNDIHGVENAISSGDAYIHDFPCWIAFDDHTDGLQTWGYAGAGGLRVVHNTIIGILTGADYSPTNYGAGSSALALIEGMHDLTIDNNLLAGGTYTIYGPSLAGSAPANVKVTNNHFSTQYYPKCGYFGQHTGFNENAPGFVWSGNIFHESGLPVDL